jgi:hypothetical protein
MDRSPGQKFPARRDHFDEVLEPVCAARKFFHDTVDAGTVRPFDPPAAGITREALRQGSGKLVYPFELVVQAPKM